MSETPAVTEDEKGRPVPALMSDRDIMVEILLGVRAMQDLAESFVKSVETNPMLAKMGAMFGMGKR